MIKVIKFINSLIPYISFILIEVSYQSYWWVDLKKNDLDFKLFSDGIFLLIVSCLLCATIFKYNNIWLSGMLSNAFGSFCDMIKQNMDSNLIVSINTYLMLFLMIITPIYFILKTKK